MGMGVEMLHICISYYFVYNIIYASLYRKYKKKDS